MLMYNVRYQYILNTYIAKNYIAKTYIAKTLKFNLVFYNVELNIFVIVRGPLLGKLH